MFITPPELPSGRYCRTLKIPDSIYWLGIFDKAVLATIYAYNYKQIDDERMTPQECAAVAYEIFEEYLNSPCDTGVPTPFWDEAQDVDDELPEDIQPWYGEIIDYTAPPYELDFVEAAGVWVITGFVAYAAGLGAAIAFQTIAPRFVLAWRRQDIGELFRVVIDAADYGTVDTSTVGVGEIIELKVLPDQSLETHDILLIKVG